MNRQQMNSNKKNNIDAMYPLTSVQHGILYHSLLDPNAGVYVEHLKCKMEGKLDVVAFEKSWQHVVDRHQILRTGFFGLDSKKPVQIVSRHVSVALEYYDWRRISPEQQKQKWENLAKDDRRRGFNFSAAPLMRWVLARTGEESYYFLWSFHHALLDGWSVPIILRETFAGYEAFQEGRDPQFDRPQPYGVYIAWLQRQDVAKAEAYWRKQLAGYCDPIHVMADHRHNLQVTQSNSAEQSFALSKSTVSALRKLAQKRRLTMNTIFQGAWALTLSRYSGRQEAVFGVTVSGRPAEITGVENMVGLFINTLPVRVKISQDTSVLDWLETLQAQNVSLRQYEYTPLEKVIDWSDVPRGTPMIDSILIFENYPFDSAVTERGLQNMSISDIQHRGEADYNLTLYAGESAGGSLGGALEYNAHLFSETTITRMLETFKDFFGRIADRPDTHLKDILKLDKAEQKQILATWNATDADYPSSRCIHELFEARAAETPDATAVVFQEFSLTYAELNGQANQLAHYLRDLGIGPDTVVAICVERSLAMVIAILGVLKAGGAYAPLDPAYPKERLDFMMADSNVRVLLTQEHLVEALPLSDIHKVIHLDAEWNAMEGCSRQNPIKCTVPQNLAYVIYTSGSTGKPKGVAVAHRSLVNHATAVSKAFELKADDRILQFASFSFDAHLEELFPTWLMGARVVLYPYIAPVVGDEFRQLIEEEGLTVLNLPTAYWRQWAHEISSSDIPLPDTLRAVIVGGESASWEAFHSWQHAASSVRWINTYGPTEATIITTMYTPGEGSGGSAGLFAPPIGRPIANVQVYILDRYMQPVPLGVPGDLYIGGVGLARGYIGRPALTAEKFVPNPFSTEAGSRLYRTGDICRYLQDGEIEFLGRADHQVKIRGYRIELEEIEDVLGRHEAIREVIVLAREVSAGDQRMIAYVVPRQGRASEISEMRGFLAEKMPAYMIPAAFVMLPSLPRSPSGKIDRKALPEPNDQLQRSKKYVPPRNPTEEIVCRLFAEVLEVERVGVYDDFFELGGHSLLAAQLIVRIRAEFKIEMPLHDLFQMHTVADVADIIEAYPSLDHRTDQMAVSGENRQQGSNLGTRPHTGE